MSTAILRKRLPARKERPWTACNISSKIIAKKITERVRISIDVGDFKEKRQDELEDLARELAILVKGDGKTQIIPSLNPSERRVVHGLAGRQRDSEPQWGEGLFKKVLIYKPGKRRESDGGEKSDTTTPKNGIHPEAVEAREINRLLKFQTLLELPSRNNPPSLAKPEI